MDECQIPVSKCANTATVNRILGNRHFAMCSYNEALRLYNISIANAPRDNISFALAVANRSAVLFDLLLFKECLEDIKIVLKSEYPKDLLYKIYIRQSKCYLELHSYVDSIQSLHKAEKNLKTTKLSKKESTPINEKILEIKSQLNELLKKGTVKDEDVHLFPLPTLTDGENPLYLNASKAVNIRKNKQFGRYVIATKDIKKGDILFIEEPYALFHQINNILYNICGLCLKRKLNCIPCINCPVMFYCSENCRQKAWYDGHRWECLNGRRDVITETDHKLSMAILFKASHDGFKTISEIQTVYGNKDNNYAVIDKLVTNKTKVAEATLKTNIKVAVWILLFLQTHTDFFDWLYIQPERPEGSREQLYKIVGGYLVKFLLQIQCNGQSIQERGISKNGFSLQLNVKEIARGIYPSTALLNHSCLPNALQSFNNATLIVRAIKDIKEGVEITISYIEKQNMYTKEDRHRILSKYSFTCLCMACDDPFFDTLRRPYACNRCNGKVFPMKETLMYGKCNECQLKVFLLKHFQNEQYFKSLSSRFFFFHDDTKLDVILKLMKSTFHKYNAKCELFYIYLAEYYNNKGEIKKCFETMKSCVDITKNIHGDTAYNYLSGSLSYVRILINYCLTLKMQHSKSFRRVYNETKDEIIKCAEIFNYYTSTETVNAFIRASNMLLDSKGEELQMLESFCVEFE